MADSIDVPEKPPLDWVYQAPDGYVHGSTLTVDYDGALWGEPGRACGLIQPPDGRRYVGGGQNHGHRIPARYPDETFSDFHVGPMQFMDGDKVVQRQVGSIAVEGGHSPQAPDFAVLAETGSMRDRIKGAVNHLQRRGKYAHLAEELAVYGRVTRVQSGPARGALLFMGAAYPWLTKHNAMAINATTNSSEQWKHPDHGGREQFIGVARVHQSSYRNDIPAVLADLDGDDAMGIVRWLDENAPDAMEQTNMTDKPLDEFFDKVEAEQPFLIQSTHAPRYVEPVMAEVEQPAFDAQTARLDALEQRLKDFEAMVSSFIISQTSGDDLTLDNRVDTLHERLPLIETTLVELREQLGKLTDTTGLRVADEPSPLLTN